MRISKHKKRKRITISPGEYHVSNEDVIISTLLGSCVSVCLYDPVCRVIGMNHFLLINEFGPEMSVCTIDSGSQGMCAMELLINNMLKTGAKYENLRAKAFGGGSMFRPFDECFIDYCVGKSNIDFVKAFLAENKIRLVNSDLGGNNGRLVHFSNGDFYAYVKKIKKISNPKLVLKDQNYWNKVTEGNAILPVNPVLPNQL